MSNTIADYSVGLVFLSYMVSVVGSLIGLLVASQIQRDGKQGDFFWLLLAAVLLGGCAIWSMHFIGMLAYQPGTPMYFDSVMTIVSLILPVLFTFVGLAMVVRNPGRLGMILLAGLIMGLGVASMHYTGMASIRIQAHLSYDSTLVAASIAIAIVASAAALYIISNLRGTARYLSALVMGLAVCGMHYTAMAALTLTPSEIGVNYFDGAVPRSTMMFFTLLAFVITCTVGAFLGGQRQLKQV